MKIDTLSDLHLDFYFKPHLTTQENVVSFFEPIFTQNNNTFNRLTPPTIWQITNCLIRCLFLAGYSDTYPGL